NIEVLSDQKVFEMYGNIHRQIHVGRKGRSLWRRIAVAASVMAFVSFGIYLFISRQFEKRSEVLTHQDMLPGGNKAVLTLADGRKIVLGDTKNGIIANEGITEIRKTDDGQLVYQVNSSKKDIN